MAAEASDANAAFLHQLILYGVISDDHTGALTPPSDIRRTLDVQMVFTGDEGGEFPPHASVDLDKHADSSGGLVLTQGEGVVRSDGDLRSVHERRPHVDVLMTLVRRRNPRTKRDLLIPVDDVDVQFVIVDADLAVWVP